MSDDLDIPTFLQRPMTPEARERISKQLRAANRSEPVRVPKADRIKGRFDAEGRRLPDSIDEVGIALLRSIERTAAKEEKERKNEAFRLLKVARDEARAIKSAAKAAGNT